MQGAQRAPGGALPTSQSSRSAAIVIALGYRPREITDRKIPAMELMSHLPTGDRERVEARLRQNLMAWLTTVRPDGQPVSVLVWFLMREDATILLYSQPGKQKLRNIADNPKVSLGLDVTDIGRNIVRMEGIASVAHDQPPASQNLAYLAKYTERIGAMFGTPERFAELFSVAVIITPTKLRI
jgi:PPOX class probable F420-dependent enzyme